MKKIILGTLFLIASLTGFTQTQVIVLEEDFTGWTGKTPQNGWQNIDNIGNDQIWDFDNAGGATYVNAPGVTTFDNDFAILDSDNYGTAGNQDAELVTPSFDLTGATSVQLYYEENSLFVFALPTIEVYTPTLGWTLLTTPVPQGVNQIIPVTIDLTAFAGESDVKIRWWYLGSYDFHWMIDNVKITATMLDMSPGCAKNPKPADAGTNVCVTGTVLNFDAPDAAATPAQDPAGYIISVWKDNAGTPEYVTENEDIGDVTSYFITEALDASTDYFWKISPYNNVETNSTCDTWSFTTAATLNPAPVIDFNGSTDRTTDVCADLDAQITLTDANGTDMTDAIYEWDGTLPTQYPLSDTAIANPVFNSSDFGTTYTLSVIVEDANGCLGTDTVDVTVKERATAGTISSSGGMQICDGLTTDLSLSGYNGDGIEWKYSYTSPTAGLQTTGDFDDQYTTDPITQSTYYVAIVDLNGCADSTNILIDKKDLPLKPFITVGSTSICDGDSTSLTAVWPVTPGTIEWNDENRSTSQEIWVKDGETYNVTGTASNGCSSTSDDVVITVNPLPSKPVVTQHSNSDYSANSNGTSYLWYRNDTLIVSSADTNFVAPQNGTYTVVASNGDCLSEPSEPFEVDLFSSINNASSIEVYSNIYPNPTSGELFVKLSVDAELFIYDLTGKILVKSTLNKGVNKIKLNLPSGLYMSVVNFDGFTIKSDKLMIK